MEIAIFIVPTDIYFDRLFQKFYNLLMVKIAGRELFRIRGFCQPFW